MFFGSFLMFVAVTIAGVSAYFSVYGLAHIFAGTFWSVVIMGGVLEVGKLVATSFLYRYWEALKWTLRIYLLSAILGLMAITSAGIFGYLSNAYQQDMVGVKDVGARIELLDTELTALSDRDKQINTDIDRIGPNFVTARQNMMKQYGPEKTKITDRIAQIRTEQLELSSKQLEVEAHTGPIIYIAKAMNKGVDEAVMWMICLIIFVFDPLAVALTIGANIALTTPNPQKRSKPVDRAGFLNSEVLDKVVDEHTEFFKDHAEQRESRHREGPRPGYLDPELLDRIVQNSEDRLFARMEATRVKEASEPVEVITEPTIPDGMELVDTQTFVTLKTQLAAQSATIGTLNETMDLDKDLIDALSSDNQRLEDELFTLATAFEKKELQVSQLKDAIRALEQQEQQIYTIKERADLHALNIAANKQQ